MIMKASNYDKMDETEMIKRTEGITKMNQLESTVYKIMKVVLQSNLVITNCLGPAKFVWYNRNSL
jgi:hypothetical protein